MLVEPTVPTRQLVVTMTPTAGRAWSLRGLRVSRLSSAFAFGGGAALVLVYALRGGAYDIVVRQEHGLIVWWVLAVGIALGLLPRARPPRAVLLLLAALAAYAAWTALSLTWTESSERTSAELARVLDYLGVVALIASVLDRRTWRAAAMGLGFGALVVCALAVASRLYPSAFPPDQAAGVFSTDRLDYPFGYWNAVGAWGAMSAAIGLIWSAHDGSRGRRAIALALVPVAILTTYLTYSRAGVGAIALALIVALAFSRNRLTTFLHALVAGAAAGFAVLAVRGAPQIAHASGTNGRSGVLAALIFGGAACGMVALLTSVTGLDRRSLPRAAARRVGAVAALALAVVAVGFGPSLAEHAWNSFKNTGTTPAATTNPTARLSNLSGTRYNLWRVAIDGFKAHPITGTGAGTYEFWWNRNQRDAEFVLNAHSLWLENMEELGLPGLLLVLAVAGTTLWVAIVARRRARRAASAGITAAALAALTVYLLSASVDWMWQSTAVTVLAIAAVAVVGSRLGEGKLQLRWLPRAAIALAAVGATAIQLPGLLSTTAIRRSQSAERAGNARAALAWANQALSAEPWSASAYDQRALVLESQHRYTRRCGRPASGDRSGADELRALAAARTCPDRARSLRAGAHRLRPGAPAAAPGPGVPGRRVLWRPRACEDVPCEAVRRG